MPGDQGGVALGLLLLPVAEHVGGTRGQGFLPGLNLSGVDLDLTASWASVSSPFTASSATLALKAGLCFLRCFDISHSFPTTTDAFSLGAGPFLGYLSSFLDPPQRAVGPALRVPAWEILGDWAAPVGDRFLRALDNSRRAAFLPEGLGGCYNPARPSGCLDGWRPPPLALPESMLAYKNLMPG